VTSTADALKRLLMQARTAHEDGQLQQAGHLYRQVIAGDPRQADAWSGLGLIARSVGARETAIENLTRAVTLAPEQGEFRMHLAWALQEHGRMADAAGHWQLACSIRPQDAVCFESLGIVLQAMGRSADALNAYARAESLQPTLALRAKQATLISPIVFSCGAMAAERARMAQALVVVDGRDLPRIEDPIESGLWTNFYLAYHGLCNRDLQQQSAQAYRRLCPTLDHVAPHCAQPRRPGRIRIGLISQFFYNHSIGRTSKGLIAQLDRADFEVTAIFIAPGVDDDFSRFIRAQAEHSIEVPQQLAAAQSRIEALQLDILFYQDIGMEPFSYFLAFSRLAPVQCVSFGHPDTTGIPTIDWWVSNDLYETEAVDAHYSERLFRLRGLGSLAYYQKPQLPLQRRTRADHGLGAEEHLYLCPQNLFKFHPDMDALIAGILRADPRGRLVLIQARIAHWDRLLEQRFAASMPDVVDRIVFLPRMATADYINLIALADVMLDTVHFNGMNTSLEAFAVGTPVVTLPGEFQRGRHTQAMYRRMGLDDAICCDAAQYVAMAVRLGTDAGARAAMSARILAQHHVLYEDMNVVREFERFFRFAVAQPADSAPSVETGVPS
jgi:protein O-GlcNAc transferase